MWIADHPLHCERAATIGLELVNTVPSFYAVLIALGAGSVHDQYHSSSNLSCIGLVTTLSKVVEDGPCVVGDPGWRGDFLVAEADGGGRQRS